MSLFHLLSRFEACRVAETLAAKADVAASSNSPLSSPLHPYKPVAVLRDAFARPPHPFFLSFLPCFAHQRSLCLCQLKYVRLVKLFAILRPTRRLFLG
jgi:hypothetical protein